MEYDWHIHTVFSPCAHWTMDFSGIVAAAMDAGLTGVGLADHPFRSGLAEHHESIDAFRKKMFAPLLIFIGAELEVAGPGRLVIDPASLPMADYIIASPSHYDVFEDEPVEDMSDAAQWADRIVADFANVVGTGADIIAHPFYVCPLIFDEPKGVGFPSIGDVLHLIDRVRLRRALNDLAEQGVALEISRRALSHPALQCFLEGVYLEFKDMGGKFSLGSDAHSLEYVGKLGERTEEIIANIGLESEQLWHPAESPD